MTYLEYLESQEAAKEAASGETNCNAGESNPFLPPPAGERVKSYLEGIAAGMTLVISNPLRALTIDKATVDSWRAVGKEVLYAKGGSIYVRRGKKVECVNFCRFELFPG